MNVIPAIIPPLRDRPSDIEPLIDYFLNRFCKKYGREKTFAPEVMDKLKTYSDVVETLFSNKGAVIVLTKAADTFQKLNGKDIKEENIKKGFKAVKMMQSYIKDLVENLSELKSLPEINLTGITTIFENINSLRAALEKDDKNNKPMWFKFFLLKLEINRAVELIKEISKIFPRKYNDIKKKPLY